MVEQTQFRVRRVTTRPEIQANHAANYLEWGRGLTRAEYLAREQHLGAQPPCRDGRIAYWTYEARDTATGASWAMVSACETLTRPALYKAGPGTPVRDTICHSIGAVFTPEEHRGKGYARKMLDLVIAKFDEGDASDSDYAESFAELRAGAGAHDSPEVWRERVASSFSVLWSDVGLYYEKFGYTASGHLELVIKLGEKDALPAVESRVELLREEDEKAFSVADAAQFAAQLEHMVERDGVPRCALVPSRAVHEMTHARAHFVAPLLRPHLFEEPPRPLSKAGLDVVKNVEHFGARTDALGMLWAQDIGNNKLNVLRTMVTATPTPSKEEVAAEVVTLLRAAVGDARAWELGKVTVWEQDVPRDGQTGDALVTLAELAAAWNGSGSGLRAEVCEREDSWPMARPFRGAGEQKFVFDGKYAWY